MKLFCGIDVMRNAMVTSNSIEPEKFEKRMLFTKKYSILSIFKENKNLNQFEAIVICIDGEINNDLLISHSAFLRTKSKNVKFISREAATFLGIIHKLNYQVKDGEVIAYVNDLNSALCKIWCKSAAKFLVKDEFIMPDCDPGDDEKNLNFLKFKNALKNVNMVFLDSLINEEIFKAIFPDIRYTRVEKFRDLAYAALIKAQINSYPKLNWCDVQNTLNRRISIFAEKTKILDILNGIPLPYTKVLTFEDNQCREISILERNTKGIKNEQTRPLPQGLKHLVIKVEINENCMYNISVDPVEPFKKEPIIPIKSYTVGSTLSSSSSSEEEEEEEEGESTDSNNFMRLAAPVLTYVIPEKFSFYDPDIDAVGIDLGTSRCCLAVSRKNGIEIVATENDGSRVMPSYVAYDEAQPKCGQTVVSRLRNYASSTVFDVKRFIGRKFDPNLIDLTWPFRLVPNDNDQFTIQLKGQSEVIFKEPEEVSAMLLKYLKLKAEEYQGRPLNDVVITVPASFDSAQILATFKAAKLAGWNNIQFLPEPIAAAYTLFLNLTLEDESHMLVFDLGGGTLDICLFQIVQKKIQIIDQVGDSHLGGRDFDNVLMDYFLGIMKKKFGLESFEEKNYKLMLECQNIKHNLSISETETLDISDFDSKYSDVIAITRAEFEKLSSPLLLKIQLLLQKLKTKFTNSIPDILLVGGASRMPMIKKLIAEELENVQINYRDNPDEVIASGAAHYAYLINQYKKLDSPDKDKDFLIPTKSFNSKKSLILSSRKKELDRLIEENRVLETRTEALRSMIPSARNMGKHYYKSQTPEKKSVKIHRLKKLEEELHELEKRKLDAYFRKIASFQEIMEAELDKREEKKQPND